MRSATGDTGKHGLLYRRQRCHAFREHAQVASSRSLALTLDQGFPDPISRTRRRSFGASQDCTAGKQRTAAQFQVWGQQPLWSSYCPCIAAPGDCSHLEPAAEVVEGWMTAEGRYVEVYIATPMHSLKLCAHRVGRTVPNLAARGIGPDSSAKRCTQFRRQGTQKFNLRSEVSGSMRSGL